MWVPRWAGRAGRAQDPPLHQGELLLNLIILFEDDFVTGTTRVRLHGRRLQHVRMRVLGPDLVLPRLRGQRAAEQRQLRRVHHVHVLLQIASVILSEAKDLSASTATLFIEEILRSLRSLRMTASLLVTHRAREVAAAVPILPAVAV